MLEARPTITLKNKSSYLSKRIASSNRQKDLPEAIKLETKKTFKRLMYLKQSQYKSNTTKEELVAIKMLKMNKNIIKQADKGSGITIVDRHQYEEEGNSHLQDEAIYEWIDYDYTILLTSRINQHLKKMMNNKEISEDLLILQDSTYSTLQKQGSTAEQIHNFFTPFTL